MQRWLRSMGRQWRWEGSGLEQQGTPRASRHSAVVGSFDSFNGLHQPTGLQLLHASRPIITSSPIITSRPTIRAQPYTRTCQQHNSPPSTGATVCAGGYPQAVALRARATRGQGCHARRRSTTSSAHLTPRSRSACGSCRGCSSRSSSSCGGSRWSCGSCRPRRVGPGCSSDSWCTVNVSCAKPWRGDAAPCHRHGALSCCSQVWRYLRSPQIELYCLEIECWRYRGSDSWCAVKVSGAKPLAR